MTTAQIYSNNNQSECCVQVLLKVAWHAASWLRACGPKRESREIPGCWFCNVELFLVLQPRPRLSYCADGIGSLGL